MKLVAVATAILIGASVHVSAQNLPYTFAGFGGISCGKWMDVRARKQSMAMEYWALGYVSGVNAFRTDGNDFVKDIDADAMWDWLDNYCRSQPLKLFAFAVMDLALVLKARAN
jgi:hypothetical protein